LRFAAALFARSERILPQFPATRALILGLLLCSCSSPSEPISEPATAGTGSSTDNVQTSAGASGTNVQTAGKTAASGGAGAAANGGKTASASAGMSGAAAGSSGSSAGTLAHAGRAGMQAATAGIDGTAGAGGAAAGSAAQSGSGATRICDAPAVGTRGKNPLFTDTFTADPGVLVHDCTFYIHCGHDEGQTGFVLKEWYVLSSTDMVNWTKEVALDLSAFSWADNNAWAGQAVEKNGKFYWYVPVNERGGGMTIGVAVGDSPKGPFKDAIGKPLINDNFEMSNAGFRTPSDTPFTIDPTVFVDDDGQAYLHYGGFGRMMVAKLGDDMISVAGKLQEVTPRGLFEAPYLFKRKGVYYEVYAAGQNPASIDYATAETPLGPFEYKGRILEPLRGLPGQDAPTSHPAVAEFAGQWYLVYHVSDAQGGGTYRRAVAIEKLTWNADGTIQPIEPSDGLTF